MSNCLSQASSLFALGLTPWVASNIHTVLFPVDEVDSHDCAGHELPQVSGDVVVIIRGILKISRNDESTVFNKVSGNAMTEVPIRHRGRWDKWSEVYLAGFWPDKSQDISVLVLHLKKKIGDINCKCIF